MTIVFNPYSLETLANPLATGSKNTTTPMGNASGNSNIFLYSSSTVPYPSSCPITTPGGFLASFANVPNTAWSLNSGIVSLSVPRSTTASVTGTVDWWLISGTATNVAICSNSVAAFGGNGIMTLDSLSTTANSNISIMSFTMTFKSAI